MVSVELESKATQVLKNLKTEIYALHDQMKAAGVHEFMESHMSYIVGELLHVEDHLEDVLQPQTPPTPQKMRQTHREQLSSRANFESWLKAAGMPHHIRLFETRKCDQLQALFDLGPDRVHSMLKRSKSMKSDDITLFMLNYTLALHMLKDGNQHCKVMRGLPPWLQQLQASADASRRRKSSRTAHSES